MIHHLLVSREIKIDNTSRLFPRGQIENKIFENKMKNVLGDLDNEIQS